eukprot:scaffold43720_cov30-Tisochrysis_lutea.AAC.5
MRPVLGRCGPRHKSTKGPHLCARGRSFGTASPAISGSEAEESTTTQTMCSVGKTPVDGGCGVVGQFRLDDGQLEGVVCKERLGVGLGDDDALKGLLFVTNLRHLRKPAVKEEPW